MLCGYPPFNTNNPEDLEGLYKSINSGKFSFEGKQWSLVSLQVKLLIADCLNVDPKKRPSAASILDYEWFDIYENNTHQKIDFDNEKYNSYYRQRTGIKN